jgi:hypothetical protein
MQIVSLVARRGYSPALLTLVRTQRFIYLIVFSMQGLGRKMD